MKCGICGKEMIKLADGINYGCVYCNIQTLLYNPNTDKVTGSNQEYIDMLNKENSELLVNSLAEKDKQIAELQERVKKLEYDNGELTSLIDTMRYEDPKIDELQKQLEATELMRLANLEEAQKCIERDSNKIIELQKQLEEKEKEIEDLKRKVNYAVDDLRNTGMRLELETFRANKLQDELKSQPAEIVEKIRKWGQKHYNWVGDGTGYDGQDYNECIGFNMAIDQLNEVLDTILKEYQK